MLQNSVCYFCKTSHSDGSIEAILTNATIYASEGKLSINKVVIKFNSEYVFSEGRNNLLANHGSKSDVLSNLWKPQIELIRPDVETEDECSLLAHFENWHMSAHFEKTCYFGILETEQNTEVAINSNLEFNFNLNVLSDFKDQKFYKRSSNRHKPFIYGLFEDTKNEEHCSMHCYFDPTGNCDFHFIHDRNCYLGNFNTQNPIGSVDGTFEMYIFKENIHDSESLLFPANTEIQTKQSSVHIKEEIEVLSEEECQAHAILYNVSSQYGCPSCSACLPVTVKSCYSDLVTWLFTPYN